jgi:26S proteasome subunit RPN7
VYEGVYCLAQRQFERAAALLLDSVATFTAAELFDYETCIFYAVVAALITLPRPELKNKACTRHPRRMHWPLASADAFHRQISHAHTACTSCSQLCKTRVHCGRDQGTSRIAAWHAFLEASAPSRARRMQVVEASEVLTVLHKLPAAKRMLHALYHCHYGEFFPGFLSVVEQLEGDAYLAPHVRYYMREALAAMAAAFGVSAAFMDAEVRRSLASPCDSGDVSS